MRFQRHVFGGPSRPAVSRNMAFATALLCVSFVHPASFVVHPAATLRRREVTKPLLMATWSDPEWNWGSANGKAHEAAARLRSSLSTPAQRESFLMDVGMMDPLDFEDSKIVLALKCQRAAKRCYAADYSLDDEEQQEWRALMNDMADCQFEGYGGDQKLAAAIGDRLGLIESKRLSNL